MFPASGAIASCVRCVIASCPVWWAAAIMSENANSVDALKTIELRESKGTMESQRSVESQISMESQNSVESQKSESSSGSSSPLRRRRGSCSNRSTTDLSSHSYGSIMRIISASDNRPVIKKSADGSMVKYQGGLKHSKSWMSHETVMTCDFNSNGKQLALGHKDGTVATFDTSTGTKVHENRLDKTQNLSITSLHFFDKYRMSRQNILLATYSQGYTALWHLTSSNLLVKIPEERQVLASAVDNTCTTFCTTGYDCSLRIYNCDSCLHQATLDRSISFTRMTGHVSRVFGVCYHPRNPNELVSAGWDGSIQFWDMRKSGSIRNISGTMVCGNSISVNPVNFSIATGSWRPKETVQIWDYNTAKLVKTIEPNFDTKVYSLQWMNEHLMVAGGAQTNNAVVIDAEKGMITGSMSGFKSGIYGVAYTHAFHKTIAVVSGESCQLALWREKPFMSYPTIPFEQKYT